MARCSVFLVALLVATALVPAALASEPRRLGYYGSPTPLTPSPKSSSPVAPVTPPTPYTSPTPKSGSSPKVPSPSTPYTYPSPKSGSSPKVPSPSTPSPYVTPPTTPSGPSPLTPTPSAPSPLSPSPITPTPSGGYGSRSGTGSSKYWCGHPWKAPKLLSLLSTIVKIFGPRALKLFGNRKTLFGALKDESPDPMSFLAREGTASLLNSYAVVGFPLSTENVLMLFDNGLNSEDLAVQQAMLFQQFNDAV